MEAGSIPMLWPAEAPLAPPPYCRLTAAARYQDSYSGLTMTTGIFVPPLTFVYYIEFLPDSLVA
jgi:hypothetical protein